MRIIPELLTDYHRIRLARRSPRWQYLTPRTARAWHEESVAFLEQALDQDPTNGDLGAAPFTRTVVVTHHAPSARSLQRPPPYTIADAAYASALEDLIVRADLWIHGHTHVRVDYEVDNGRGGATRVVSNPRGYVGVEPVQAFDPGWIVTVPLS